jgi:hypothetical protein
MNFTGFHGAFTLPVREITEKHTVVAQFKD